MKQLALCSGLAMALSASAANAADLMEAFEMALQSDPQLRTAAAQLRSTGEFKNQAWANFLPQINGQGRMTRGDSDVSIAGNDIPGIPSTDNENYNVSLNQTIYNRSNYAQLNQSRAQLTQAEADYEVAANSLAIRVAEAYFGVLTAEDALTFAEAELKANERQLEQAEQRYEVGLTAITDVYEARASYDGARARVIQAENTKNDAHEALDELTGEPLSNLETLQPELPSLQPEPADPNAWVDTALQSNPALQSSRAAAEVAAFGIDRQRSAHWPTLSASASYNDFTNNNRTLTDDFGQVVGTAEAVNRDTQFQITLDVPIYSGGAVSSRVRQAVADHDAALERAEQQRRAIVRQSQNAYRSVIAGISEVEARRQAVVSGQKALEATEAGFEVGTRTIVDVLLSQRTLFSAQSEYSRARHNLILDSLRLKQAAGTIAPSDIEGVNRLLQ